MARERRVGVWLHGRPVGQITSRKRTEVRFRYDDEAREHGLNVPVLSCSLPTSTRTVPARPFFAGLLPEGDARRKLAADAGLVVDDVLGLLLRYGQDVAGAVVVGDEVSSRPRARADLYTDADLFSDVVALSDRSAPLALHDDSELSIAGLQDKMLLVRTAGGWARPVNGFPSTHILKIDDRAHHGLVIAEHVCLAVARAAGLPASRTQLERIGDLDILIVERFDRAPGVDGVPERIHQEDACQALGVDLEANPRAKHEQHGGPRLRQVATVLRSWGTDEDLYRLLDQVVFTVAIGNADAHGKNISVLHRTLGTVQLAPLYDTTPTLLWPTLRARAAMSVGGVVDLTHAGAEDIVREAQSWHLPVPIVRERVLRTLNRVRVAVDELDVPDHEMAARTVHLIRTRTDALLTGAA